MTGSFPTSGERSEFSGIYASLLWPQCPTVLLVLPWTAQISFLRKPWACGIHRRRKGLGLTGGSKKWHLLSFYIPPPFSLSLFRPPFRRNCTSGSCETCWRVGPWKPCTAVCGRGFQSRKVDCVHVGSCKPVADRHCVRMKPAPWRHCLGPSCDSTYPSQVSPAPQQPC